MIKLPPAPALRSRDARSHLTAGRRWRGARSDAGSLWPAISGLLRKDPDRRLGAAEAERMLRRATRGGVAQPQWGSRRTLGALAATLAVTAAAATAFTLALSDSPGRSPAAFPEGSHPSAPRGNPAGSDISPLLVHPADPRAGRLNFCHPELILTRLVSRPR